MSSKLMKEAVAFYAVNSQGAFLCVKRSDDDDSLPGVWGLPAGSLREGELPEDAVARAARDKLGVEAKIKRYVGDDTQERAAHTLHLREYEIEFPKEVINLRQTDPTASRYAAFQWATDPEVLRDAAEKGSSCSRIFLHNRGLLLTDNKAVNKIRK